jgi:hypothetical protein
MKGVLMVRQIVLRNIVFWGFWGGRGVVLNGCLNKSLDDLICFQVLIPVCQEVLVDYFQKAFVESFNLLFVHGDVVLRGVPYL